MYKSFLNHLQTELEQTTLKNKRIVTKGDLNIDVHKIQVTHRIIKKI